MTLVMAAATTWGCTSKVSYQGTSAAALADAAKDAGIDPDAAKAAAKAAGSKTGQGKAGKGATGKAGSPAAPASASTSPAALAATVAVADGQAALIRTLPVLFTLTFAAPVDPATVVATDVVQTGTASGVTWTVTDSGDHTSFVLAATAVTGDGTLQPSLPAGLAHGADGAAVAATTALDAGVTFDTAAPGAPVVTGPVATNLTTPTWTWTSGGGGDGHYRLRLDASDLTTGAVELQAATWTPATGLADGAHTLYVEERDDVGNWSAAGSFQITVDTSLPGAPVVTGTTPVATATPAWTWTSGGNGGNGTYRWKLDGSDLTTGATTTTATALTAGSALADGAHTLYVEEQNAQGHWSAPGSFAVTVDTTPPAAPVVTSAAALTAGAQPSWTWTSGGNGGNGTYRWKLDDTDLTTGATTTTTASYTAASALAEGAHTLYVEERDAVGNWSSAGSYAVTVDLTPPSAPVVTSAAAVTAATQPTWTWTSGGGGNGTYRYKFDASDLTTGATTTTTASAVPPAALADGLHTLYVEERDAAGNWSSAGSYDVTVDTTPPTAPVVTGPASPTGNHQPAWTWTSGGGGNGTYRYKLDSSDLTSGATSTTTAGFTPASALADGTHTLYVQERDGVGNWSAAGSFAVTLTSAAPGAPVVSGSTPTNATQPTWTWTSGGSGSGTYRWKLDGTDLTSGATTTTATTLTPGSALAEGAHTLYVQEQSSAGNWSTSGSFQIVVDTTAPGLPVVTGPSVTGNQEPTWSWTSGGSGGSGTYRVKLDDSDLTSGASTTTSTTFVPGANLAEGTHTLYVQERDAAGNWSGSGSYAVTIDLTAPTAPAVTSAASLTNVLKPTWTWTSGGGGNGSYRWKLDSNDFSSGGTTGNATTYTPAANLADGSHTLYVEEADPAGNWSAAGSYAVTVDTTPPTAPAVTSAAAVTSAQQPTWTWTSGGSGSGTYRYRLDATDFTTGTTTTTTASFTPASNLAEGAHTLYVEEVDAAGNWSSQGSYAVTVDTTPPGAPVVSGPATTNNQKPTWTWTSGGSGGNGSYRYKLDDADLTSGTTATSSTTYTAGANLAEGTHTLYVEERDAAGNWSSAGSFTVTVDLTPPAAPTVTSAAAMTNAAKPTWTWASGGGSGSYRLKLDSSDFSSGVTATSSATYTPASNLADGSHTLYVEESDAAGNWSSAGSYAVTVDTTAPTNASSLHWTTGAATNAAVTYAGSTSLYLVWTAGSDAGSGVGTYTVAWYAGGVCSGTATFITGLTGTSTTLTGTNGSSYSFKVTTYDNVGNSNVTACSGAVTVDTDTPNQPSAPTDGGQYASAASLTFSWSNPGDVGPAGVASYDVQIGTTAGGHDVFDGNVTATSKAVTGADGSTYYARVRAVDAAGNAGVWSANSDGILVDLTNPTAASGMKVVPDSTTASAPASGATKSTTLYLVWSAGSDAGSGLRDYTVHRYSQASCAGTATDTTGVTTTSQSLTGVDGTTYSFTVDTFDNAGRHTVSSCSNNLKVDTTPPPALSAFSGASGTGSGDIVLTVTFPGTTTDYDHVDVRRLAGATAPNADCASDGTVVKTYSTFSSGTLTDHTGSPNSHFSYRACIYDAAGNLTSSNTALDVTARGVTHTMFVTSATFNGDLGAGYTGHTGRFAWGLEGADYRCQYLAGQASLTGTWRALISDQIVSAKSRIHFNGPIYNMNNQLVANNATEFWSSTFTNIPKYTEANTAITNAQVWTGANADGTPNTYNTNCGNMTTSSGSYMAYGYTGYLDSRIIFYTQAGACTSTDHLYCINEVAALPALSGFSAATGATTDGDVDLSLTFPSDTSAYDRVEIRRVAGSVIPDADCASDGTVVATIHAPFTDQTVTDATGSAASFFSYRACAYDASGNFNGSPFARNVKSKGVSHTIFTSSTHSTGGFGALTNADAICQTDATNAGLGGTYKAIISGTGVNAKDRITISGPIFDTVGQLIATDAADLWNSSIGAKLNHTQTGAIIPSSQYVWTGSNADGTSNTTYNCSNWSTTVANGRYGRTDYADTYWFQVGSTGTSCGVSMAFYCISQ